MGRIYRVSFLFCLLFLFLGMKEGNAAGPYFTPAGGNWNVAGTWKTVSCALPLGGAVPTAADDITICAGQTVTVNAAGMTCHNLTIIGTLTFATVAVDLTVTGTLTISGGTLSFPKNFIGTLNITGDLVNTNGTVSYGNGNTALKGALNLTGNLTQTGAAAAFSLGFNAASSTKLSFVGASTSTVTSSGGGSFSNIYTIGLNKSTKATLVDIQSDDFIKGLNTSNAGFLLNTGTFKLDNGATGATALTNFVTSGTVNLTIPFNVVIESDAGTTMTLSNGGHTTLCGKLNMNGGTVFVSTTAMADLIYHDNGGVPELDVVANSILTIAGAFNDSTLPVAAYVPVGTNAVIFNMNGGTITLNTPNRNNPTSGETFGLSNVAGGKTIMSGGTIIMENSSNNVVDLDMGGPNVGAMGSANYNVSGGTVQFGDINSKVGGNIFTFVGWPTNNYPNIVVNGTGIAESCEMIKGSSDFQFLSLTLLASTTFNMVAYNAGAVNGHMILMGADAAGNAFSDAGTFTPSNSQVLFNGTVAQNITGTVTCPFYDVVLEGTGAVNLLTPATAHTVTFNANATPVVLNQTVATATLTTVSDVTINQPIAAVTNSWNINTGTATVGGNLVYVGASPTNIAQVSVTSGALTVTGTANFAATNVTAASQLINVTTGSLTFSSLYTLGTVGGTCGTIAVTGATGIINFNASPAFTCDYTNAPVFTTVSGATLNFKGNLTCANGGALTFNPGSNSIFVASGTVTPSTTALSFGNIQINAAKTVTAAGNFNVAGNWINNGTAFTPGLFAVTFNGAAAQQISGTTATTFYDMILNGLGGETLMTSATAHTLVFNVLAGAVTFTHNAAGINLTTTSTVTINQPGSAATSSWNINAGTATVGTNLVYVGTSATNIAQTSVTTGTLTVTGTVNFDAANTAAAGQLLNVTTGVMNFTSLFTLGTVAGASGTLAVTGATGIINFNASPAFTCDYTNAPVFTTVSGATLNFKGNLTCANGGALTFNPGSNSIFVASGTVTPSTTALSFGNIQINAAKTVTAAGNFNVAGNWINNGTAFTPGLFAVTFNGAAAQQISGTTATTFYDMILNGLGGETLMTSATAHTLVFNALAGAVTFTHNAAGINLTTTSTVTINQPGSAATSSWNINAGTATVGTNLVYVGTVAAHVAQTSVTTGTLTVTGTVNFDAANTAAAGQLLNVTTGTLNFTSLFTLGTVAGASGTLAVTGATGIINFNAAPAFTCDYTNAPVFTTVSGATLNFNGNLTCAHAGSLTFNSGSNSIFTANATITPSTTTLTFGNIQINAAKTVVAAGNFNVSGNWTNKGTAFTAGAFGVTFNGNAAQTINGGTSTTFNNLIIANTAVMPIGVTQNIATQVSGVLTLNTGAYVLNTFTLTVQSSATTAITGGSATAYIISEDQVTGNMSSALQWNVANLAAPVSYIFPFGYSGSYIPFTFHITAAGSAATTVTLATYESGNGTNLPYPSMAGQTVISTTGSANNLAGCDPWVTNNSALQVNRYWEITVGGVLPTADLTFSYLGSENQTIASCAGGAGGSLAAERYDKASDNWGNGTCGTCDGGVYPGAAPGVTAGVGTVMATGVSTFSPWTLVTAANPLPIELLRFSAVLNKEVQTDLSWTTATETNNDYFTIERTTDGSSYEFVGKVKGAGNSTQKLSYSMKDMKPLPGVSYYRLSQTDFNGKITSFKPMPIDNNKVYTFNVFPNPSQGDEFFVTLSGEIANKEILVVVYNETGQMTYSKVVLTGSSNNLLQAIDPSNKLSPGVYLVVATSDNAIFRQKIIIY